LRWLAAVCIVLVTHGSLYPWRFAMPGNAGDALLTLFMQRDWWTGLGDVAGNVALFVPVGVLGTLLAGDALALLRNAYWLGAALAIGATLGARLGPLAAGLAACVLALEGAQTWLAGRIAEVTPALIPLFWWLALRAARR